MAAEAVSDSYELLRVSCIEMDTQTVPQQPETVVMIQLREPVIYKCPQELYSWGTDWEVRCRNEASAVVSYRSGYNSDREAFLNSEELNVNLNLAYLLSPCTGFSAVAPRMSVSEFAELFGTYMELNRGYLQLYDTAVIRTKDRFERIIKELAETQKPSGEDRTDELLEYLENILIRMSQKEDFSFAFKSIYHRLAVGEEVSLEEMIETIYINGIN